MSAWTVSGCKIAILLAILMSGVAAGADAVLDAKRKAAADLIREGKLSEAVALLKEVNATGAGTFRDTLLLARSYDRLNRAEEAAKEYRRVIEMLEKPGGVDERAARQEAERRLKVLDQYSGRIDSVVDDVLKKLVQLERDADLAKNRTAAERLFRIRAAICQYDGRDDRGGAIVPADQYFWTHTGFWVKKGETCRAITRGTWRVGNGPSDESDSDGIKDRKFQDKPVGAMYVSVHGQKDGVEFTSISPAGTVFVAPASGEIVVTCWENASEKKDNSGVISVMFERQRK